jgi:hypothetical protein
MRLLMRSRIVPALLFSLRRMGLVAMAVVMAAPGSAQNSSRKTAAVSRATVPMATYTEAGGVVSFEYPIVWKVDTTAKFYLGPHILQSGLSPQVQVIFSPVGNSYAKTNLTNLVFVYAKAPGQSDEACRKLAMGSDPAKSETISIDGKPFQHVDTGDAGMCHGTDQHIYWTRQNGTCYLFEGDMLTTCSGAVDGQLDLTKTETWALLRHLQAIPQSIRFAPQR